MEELKKEMLLIGSKIPNPFLIYYLPNEEMIPPDLHVIIESIKQHNHSECSLIISGGGGHFSPALDLGVALRDKYKKKLSCYIPSHAASALGYIVLLSNRAYCITDEPLSQLDLTFDYKGNTYRAREELKSDDKKICDDARFCWRTNSEIIRRILLRKDSLYKPRKLTEKHLGKIMDLCLRKRSHSNPIRINRLIDLGFKIQKINGQIGSLLENIDKLSIKILKQNRGRFIVGNKDFLLRQN